MKLKKLLKYITPPIIFIFYNWFKNLLISDSKNIFEGDFELFSDLIKNCIVYGEYGCGKTTLWVAKNSDCKILSVDSSLKWINLVEKKLNVFVNPNRFELLHSYCGEISDFGYPKDYSERNAYYEYFNSIWERDLSPDLVLIDGRFRVACFLTSLLRSKPGTKILFDDYSLREEYHIIEDFITPKIKTKRQALFIKPKNIDEKKIIYEINKFNYVKE